MPIDTPARVVKRVELEYAQASVLAKELPELVKSFEDKTDTEIQNTLHEWAAIVYDLNRAIQKMQEGKRTAFRDAYDLKMGLCLRLRNWFSPRYGWDLGDSNEYSRSDGSFLFSEANEAT